MKLTRLLFVATVLSGCVVEAGLIRVREAAAGYPSGVAGDLSFRVLGLTGPPARVMRAMSFQARSVRGVRWP